MICFGPALVKVAPLLGSIPSKVTCSPVVVLYISEKGVAFVTCFIPTVTTFALLETEVALSSKQGKVLLSRSETSIVVPFDISIFCTQLLLSSSVVVVDPASVL